MKYALIILSLVTSAAYADCLCRSMNMQGYKTFEKQVASADDCKAEILTNMHERFLQARVCVIEKTVDIKWACGTADTELEKKAVDCGLFRDMQAADQNYESFKILDDSFGLNKPLTACSEKQDDNEDHRLTALEAAERRFLPPTPKVGLQFKNRSELEAALYDLKNKGLKLNVSNIFDRLKNGSFSMNLQNDNLVTKLGTKGSGSDRGLTHGLSMKMVRNIGDGTYTMILEYDSALYTSYADPVNPDYRKIDGVTHVSQTLVEENISRMVIAKAKNGDAFYWSAGGGVHEINRSDFDRNMLFSAAKQQIAFHEYFIGLQQKGDVNKNVTTKRYHNVATSGSDYELFVEGNVGKRISLPIKSRNFRAFIDANVGGRLTGVNGASYASGEVSLNADLRLTGDVALRTTAGRRAKVYITGQKTSEEFIEVTLGSRTFQQGFRIVNQDRGRMPAYLNPVAPDYANRDANAPKASRTYQLFFRVAW